MGKRKAQRRTIGMAPRAHVTGKWVNGTHAPDSASWFGKMGIAFARQGKDHLRNLTDAHIHHRKGVLVLALSPSFSSPRLPLCPPQMPRRPFRPGQRWVSGPHSSGGTSVSRLPLAWRSAFCRQLYPPNLPTTSQPSRPLGPSIHPPIATPHVLPCAGCAARLLCFLLLCWFAPACAWVWPRLPEARNDSAPSHSLSPSSTIPVDRNDVAFEISYPGFSTPKHGSMASMFPTSTVCTVHTPYAVLAERGPWVLMYHVSGDRPVGAQSARLASNLYI